MNQYLTEIILSLAVGFMIYYPPEVGVLVLIAVIALVLCLKWLEGQTRKPDLLADQRDREMHDLKSKVEQLILSRNR